MYNAERYVVDCLNSILAQTFDNYEVIVVDDCSTDNSVAIVENYAAKFGGRLKLERTKTNSGGASVPRNVGLPFSRGEYIYFMDADDLIAPNALAELYTSAKNFGAEVVYTERWFDFPENFGGATVDKNFVLRTTDEKNFKDMPLFESDDPAARVAELIGGRFHAVVWKKLVLRDLLIRNEIDFPNCHVEDFCWTLKVLYHAKKILRMPTPIYFYRQVSNSLARQRDTDKLFNQTLNSLILGVKAVDEFMTATDFFKENMELRYAIFDCFAGARLRESLGIAFQTSSQIICEIIRENQQNLLEEHCALIAYLYAFINTQQQIAAVNQQRFNEFAAQAQARIAELEAQLKTK